MKKENVLFDQDNATMAKYMNCTPISFCTHPILPHQRLLAVCRPQKNALGKDI